MPPPSLPPSQTQRPTQTKRPSSAHVREVSYTGSTSPNPAQPQPQESTPTTVLTSHSQTPPPNPVPKPTKETEKPRQLTPFFTLVTDAGEGEERSTHHPTQVHYLFSDDDGSAELTSALVRSLENGGEGDVGLEGGEEEDEEESNSSSSATFRKDGTRIRSQPKTTKSKTGEAKRQERVVIVDINETGDAVVGVSSLSPEWQVINAEMGKAPTWDGADSSSPSDIGGGEGGMMLKIEGVGLSSLDSQLSSLPSSGTGSGAVGGKGKGKEREIEGSGQNPRTGEVGEEEMQVLLESFDRKMSVLRRIVERGSPESLGGGEEA